MAESAPQPTPAHAALREIPADDLPGFVTEQVAVRRRFEKRFGCALPATLLWHRPTAGAISDFIVRQLT